MLNSFEFADRTKWPLATNQVVATFQKQKDAGNAVIDLTLSNPTLCSFNYPREDILEPLSNKRNLIYQPSPKGHQVAREVIARQYKPRGLDISPDQIFLTASTSEAYTFLFRLLVNPQQRVLFPQPSYPLFPFLCDLNDVVMDYYTLKFSEDEWRLDLEQAKNLYDENLRAFVLVNPNNPTGSYIKIDELTSLAYFAQQHQIALICDEVFWDFKLIHSDRYGYLGMNKDVLGFTLGGLSKSLILPQMKLAWILVTGPKNLVRASIERLEVIADTYLSINAPVQNALSAWMTVKDRLQDEVITRLETNDNVLRDIFHYCNRVHILPVEGGWYGIIKLPSTIDEEELVLTLLREDLVYVHPGYFFDFEDQSYIVVSLIVEEELFLEGIKRIRQKIDTLLEMEE